MMSELPVRFWFDPCCPWTWITYRWLKEVQTLRSLDVELRLLSLTFLNQDRPDESHVAVHRAGHRLERVIQAAATAGDPANAQRVVGDLYAAMGAIIHVAGRDLVEHQDAIIAESLAACSLPTQLAAAADDVAWDGAIRQQHDQAMALVGNDVGAPVIAVGDVAFFGPVLSPAPHGQDALRAWDGCVALAQTPGFFELKRTRTVGPIIDPMDQN
jgi:2-hydroxychromene-2-carboxylate isomerase